MGFRLVPKSVILNGHAMNVVMAVIVCYSVEFGSFGHNYVQVVTDRSV